MTTKQQLYNTLEKAENLKLMKINKQIHDIKESGKDDAWKEFVAVPEFKSIIESLNNIFCQLDKVPVEETTKYNFHTDVKVLTTFHNYNYRDFEDDLIRQLLKKHKPTRDKIIPLEQLKNSIRDEYKKLDNYVKVHSAKEGEKFLTSLGFTIEQPIKHELEVINVDRNLL